MTDIAARAAVVRDAMHAAVTGDEAVIERVYTADVSGWSPVMEVVSRDDLAARVALSSAAATARRANRNSDTSRTRATPSDP